MTRDEALAFLAVDAKTRYPMADTVLLCGSTAANKATAASDLDLVVLFAHLPDGAFRETVDAGSTLVESFCHDLGTLRRFVENGRLNALPLLAIMVTEGFPVSGFPGLLVAQACRIAQDSLDAGPPPWPQSTVDHQRYTLASLADDLRSDQALGERLALASALHAGLATFALRTAGRFIGNGKGLALALARHDSTLANDLADAVLRLVADGNARPINAVVDRVLAPQGGRLVAGYRAQAPANLRTDP